MRKIILAGVAMLALTACRDARDQSWTTSYDPSYVCTDGAGRRVPERQCEAARTGGLTNSPYFWYYVGSMAAANRYSYGSYVDGGRRMDRGYRPAVIRPAKKPKQSPVTASSAGLRKPLKPDKVTPMSSKPSSTYSRPSTTRRSSSSYSKPSTTRRSSSSYSKPSSSRPSSRPRH